MSFKCPYCHQTFIGKVTFDKHVAPTGNCTVIRTKLTTPNSALSFEFPSHIQNGVCNGDLALIPIQTGTKTFKLSVVPSRKRFDITLNSEQKMIQRWVECWLRSRSRGDKEASINDMMVTATHNAYDTGIYSPEAIKTLRSHCTETGRQRFLKKNDASFINPKRVTMPRGEPAFIFPFIPSLLRELENEDVSKLLQYSNLPTLLESIKAVDTKTVFPLLHVDDINLCNPLGSKAKKHSIRIIQWQIYNLPPWYRAKIEAKHPLAIAHANSFKCSKQKAWQIILDDFIKALKKYQNGGLQINLTNESVAVRLGSILGDGLGIFEILGLTMSFGPRSKHVCFLCDIGGGENINLDCRPKSFSRTRDKILAACQKIAMAPSIRIRATDRTKEDLKQLYGIHFRTPFFDLDYVRLLKTCNTNLNHLNSSTSN